MCLIGKGQRKESSKVCASGLHSRRQSRRLFPPMVSERQRKEVDLGLRNGPSVAIQSGNDHLQHIWGLSSWHFYIVTYAAEPRRWGWVMGENPPCVRLGPAEITNCASGFLKDIKRRDLKGDSPLSGEGWWMAWGSLKRLEQTLAAPCLAFWPWDGAPILTQLHIFQLTRVWEESVSQITLLALQFVLEMKSGRV